MAERQITLLVVGCGSRGTAYSNFALDEPSRAKVVAVAEPREYYRNAIADPHSVTEENRFKTWEEAAALPKLADAVVIATPDQLHTAPAVAFAKLGYAILLEKPMAVTEADCEAIVNACEANNTILAVGHVLRYTSHVRIITDLIQSGKVGDVLHLQHTEPVGNWHFAHSFVRGNWRNESTSTFSLMAKCCHDMDLICHWMRGQTPVRVASFGSLSHFREVNAPAGAADRCLDCPAASTCPYDAKKIYVTSKSGVAQGNKNWPVDVVSEDRTVKGVMEALRTGPYGRCAYKCDNDVADNQVVMMEYGNGATATLTMVATTELICQRQTKVSGSLGEITCTGTDEVIFRNFVTNETEIIPCVPPPLTSRLSGHGYADYYLMDAFVRAVATGDAAHVRTTPTDCFASHKMVFVAEQARREGRVVDLANRGGSARDGLSW